MLIWTAPHHQSRLEACCSMPPWAGVHTKDFCAPHFCAAQFNRASAWPGSHHVCRSGVCEARLNLHCCLLAAVPDGGCRRQPPPAANSTARVAVSGQHAAANPACQLLALGGPACGHEAVHGGVVVCTGAVRLVFISQSHNGICVAFVRLAAPLDADAACKQCCHLLLRECKCQSCGWRKCLFRSPLCGA